MNLLTLFLLSQTIYAILGITFFAVFLILIVMLYFEFKKLDEKVTNAIDEGIETVEETRGMINKIGKKILDYYFVKLYKKINNSRKK